MCQQCLELFNMIQGTKCVYTLSTNLLRQFPKLSGVLPLFGRSACASFGCLAVSAIYMTSRSVI